MHLKNTPTADEARILLIEEHASNVMITRRLLERFGIRHVYTAANGSIGLNMLKTSRPDVILMDCTMPGLDGYDATRLIRMKEMEGGDAHVPIIGMTANNSTTARDNCLLAGMNGCAHKPIDPVEMHGLLSQYIELRGFKLPEIEEGEITNDNELMDLSIVAQFARAGNEPLQMLVMAYLEECEHLLKILRVAWAEKNALGWAQTIHNLRGSSANIGAREMESLANRRQERLPAPEAGDAIIQQIQDSFDKTTDILRDYLKDYPWDKQLFI